ncbi:signal transduction histidine kinase [Oikeobacillus pervagus]|uniref:Heme sensor protein HssS n=1 Tax=Oikeobacillus pervagus TaxID=1325931 RepID=A0AAJ1T1A6_9BACI|nr:HAMP domain-containing sensor histidine kinase [Oikeobacillus pervagus]MDQ0216745.1 signal transduction histidine kinase [Oikeobacillus pervagus]
MRNLTAKFSATFITIMVASSIIAFFLSNYYYQHILKPLNDEKNTKIAVEIATFAEKHPEIHIDDYLDQVSRTGYQIYLVSQQEEEQFFGTPYRVKYLPKKTIEDVLSGKTYHGIEQFPTGTFITGFFANELINTIGVPLTIGGHHYAMFVRPDIKLLFNEMHVLFGWLLLLTILLSILFVMISTKFLIKPIHTLTNATKKLKRGDFSIELDIHRHDEIGQLALHFTDMAHKLERMIELRKEFTSNITHDIQSPLSNIKGYIQLLQNDSLREEERQQYLQIIESETNRLSKMTKQLLILNSLEQSKDLLKKKKYNVAHQLKDLIRSYQWKTYEQNIMISYSLPDTMIMADPELLQHVWENLFTNAMKYNHDGGSIDITLAENETNIIISFKDTGIGLSDEEKERIFDRFYRVDASRSKKVEGTGLGLSIVQSVIMLHNGKIHVESTKEEGTTFIIHLPKL